MDGSISLGQAERTCVAVGGRVFALKAEDADLGGDSSLSLLRERKKGLISKKTGREIPRPVLILVVNSDYGMVPLAAAAGVLVVKENHPASPTSPAMFAKLEAAKTPVKSGAFVSSDHATIQY